MPITEKTKNSKKRPDSNKWIRYSGMGMQLAALMLLGAWLGHKLDLYWQIERHLLLGLFTILGLFLGMFLLIKDLMKHK